MTRKHAAAEERETLEMFAVAAPGLATLVGRELDALGIDGTVDEAGVTFNGDELKLYRANLWSRTASRIVVRLASFEARTFADLERRSAKVKWGRVLRPGAPAQIRVTCRKSRLYHSGAVAQRVGEAIANVTDGDVFEAGAEAESGELTLPPQLIIVRVWRDQVTISADSSGALLHVRGYRRALARAPLRETLAASLLTAAGWSGNSSLIDPMCGSGTIPIEGALIARRIAPGLQRAQGASGGFAFEKWPTFDGACWAAVKDEALAAPKKGSIPPIRGFDRDDGAIEAARANAERAGVAGDIVFERAAVSELQPIGRSGLVATNPPYGVRVGDRDALRDLYAAFGRVLKERFGGWELAMLSAGPELERQLRLPLQTLVETNNGGIPIRFRKSVLTGGPANE